MELIPSSSFNVYLSSGSTFSVAFLFVLHGFIALCYAVGARCFDGHCPSLTAVVVRTGYYTKLMQVLLWLFCNGIMDRHPPIFHGGDTYARTCALEA